MTFRQGAEVPVNLELGVIYQRTSVEDRMPFGEESLAAFSVGAFLSRRVGLPEEVFTERTSLDVVPEVGVLYTPYSGGGAGSNEVGVQAALGLSLAPSERLLLTLEPSVAYHSDEVTPGIALGLMGLF